MATYLDGVDLSIGVGDSIQSGEIDNNAVTNPKLADMAQTTVKGRETGSTGDPQDLTAAQTRAILGLDTADSPTFADLTLTGDLDVSGHVALGADATVVANDVVVISEIFVDVNVPVGVDLDIQSSGTPAAGRVEGINLMTTCSIAAGALGLRGFLSYAILGSSQNAAADNFRAFEAQMETTAFQSGTVADCVHYETIAPIFSGSKPTDVIAFHAVNMGVAGVVNAYGIKIEDQTGATNNFPIHQTGTNGTNVFNALSEFAKVVIDVTDIEALLVRKDGDTGDVFTVNTANSRVLISELRLGGTQAAGSVINAPSGGLLTSRNNADDGNLAILATNSFDDLVLAASAVRQVFVETKVLIDDTDTEAFLVRKDADGGDVLAVNTTSSIVKVTGELNITAAFNHDGTLAAFYGVAPVARPVGYTQTFSAATRTHAAFTSATLTDSSGGTANTTVVAVPVVNGSGATTAQEDAINDNFADVVAQINALRVDLDNAKQVLNQSIDDDQLIGLKDAA